MIVNSELISNIPLWNGRDAAIPHDLNDWGVRLQAAWAEPLLIVTSVP